MPDGMTRPALVTEPGIYPDMDADTYHADPCPTPSLSAGMINDLLVAPAKCRENSRRLNPDWQEPEGAERFTVGTVSHIIHLEDHLFDQKVVVLAYDDWKKKEAKEARASAKAEGKTAILQKHLDKVLAARAAFHANAFVRDAFANGKREQSLFWRHPVHGFWCRARPDFIADAASHLCDYKATGNADPAQFGRHAYNLGYHRRAAWYLEGARTLFGANAFAHYWFVNQETSAPFLPAVVELNWAALEDGKAENDLAADLFARCLRTGDWYGYRHRDAPDRDRAFQVALPTYACMQIDERLGRSYRTMRPEQQFIEEDAA